MEKITMNIDADLKKKIDSIREQRKKRIFENIRYLLELGIQKHNENSGKDKINHLKDFADANFKNQLYSRKMLEMICQKMDIESEIAKEYARVVAENFKEDKGING